MFFKKRSGKAMQNIVENKSDFVIGDTQYYQLDPESRHFYLAEDTSLLYHGLQGDYSVLLGGNWRFELVVDCLTGLCTQVQGFLYGLEVTYAALELPKSELKDLYFISEKPLVSGGGCYYLPFAKKAFWDAEKKILCYGDPHSNGEAVEFTSKTIAVIENKRLMCVYLILDDMREDIVL